MPGIVDLTGELECGSPSFLYRKDFHHTKQKMFRWYERNLFRRPLFVKTATGTLLGISGDYTAQRLEGGTLCYELWPASLAPRSGCGLVGRTHRATLA